MSSNRSFAAWWIRCHTVALASVLVFLLTGCTVPVAKHRRLVRPAMQFSGPAAFGATSRLTPQLESGAAVSGGAQAAGCSSCR